MRLAYFESESAEFESVGEWVAELEEALQYHVADVVHCVAEQGQAAAGTRLNFD